MHITLRLDGKKALVNP